MEYPPLVAGRTSLFAVHLTTMADFKPVSAGQATIEFTPESGGAAKTLAGPQPSRPGVFRVEDTPPPPGRYRWALRPRVAGPVRPARPRLDHGVSRRSVGQTRAPADQPDDPPAIAYLKEQQWTNEFATALVSETDVRTSVRAPATVHPLPGGEAIVAAPAAGRLQADVLLSIGDRVRSGQVLAYLEPRLAAGADRATLAADVAEAQRGPRRGTRRDRRAPNGLLAERAVPARRVEDARRSDDGRRGAAPGSRSAARAA